ncbi:MAG TPA: hypothetical protein VGJ05_10025 [Fimbriiglobus sp.]|jgi:hypothetical protein
MSRKYPAPNPKDHVDEERGITVLYPRSGRSIVGGISFDRPRRTATKSKTCNKPTGRWKKSSGSK